MEKQTWERKIDGFIINKKQKQTHENKNISACTSCIPLCLYC